MTETFDRSLFPDGARQQPGPLTMKDELPKLPMTSTSSSYQNTESKITGVTTIQVKYMNEITQTLELLSGARVSYTVYDGLGRERSSSTEVVDDNGNVTIPCYSDDIHGSGSYSGTIHVQDNYRLRVYHPQTGSDVVGSFSGEFATDCGQQIPVQASFKMSHVFKRMSQTISKSRSFFQEQRGKIDVHIEWDVDNSFYCGSLPPFISPWCSDGGDDVIVIKDRPGADGYPDSHIGGPYGDFVVAHEYGHAMHAKALGGNVASGECPSPHYLDGAHNLQCAFSEGFANYHGAVGVKNGNIYVNDFEQNEFYPAVRGGGDPDDGSIIEGAVAAFLWDLTDPSNESHDGADYPGSYVADIIKTCKTDGSRANGVDHLIACFQRQIPSYSGYFDTRSSSPSSFSESATEPGSWNRTDVKALWRKNLYGENYDGPPLTVSVSDPVNLDEGEQGTWTASTNLSGASYTWFADEGAGWFQIGTGSSVTWGKDFISSTITVDIKVEAVKGSETASAQTSVIINNNDGGGGCNGVTPNQICP